MAVSGRKTSDVLESVSATEDYDHKCDPCLTADLHVEAHGFCVDCHEYLCRSCFTFHQRTKALRHHQLLDKDSIDEQTIPAIPAETSDEWTEKCSIHKKEVIKFFCLRHEALGCSDCMVMGHRTCDLEYIPDKCVNIGDSDECMETIKVLDKRNKDTAAIMNKASVKDREIDDEHNKATQEINNFRKEIDSHLDDIQKKSQIEVDNRQLTDKQTVKSVLASCTTLSLGLEKLQASIQNSKTLNQNGKLFVDIKRAKLELKSTAMQQAEECLDKLDTQYVVERNEDIEGILSKETSLINIGRRLPKLPSQASVIAFTHAEDIKVRTKEDKTRCNITGCAVLSSDKLVIADHRNKAIKIVDICRKTVTEEKILDSQPFDVAVLPNDQIAVTISNRNQIRIMTTVGKLSLVSTLNVDGYCVGIIHHSHSLYVVCQTPRRVLMLDMKGNVRKTVSLANESKFFNASFIAMSQDKKSIYVSSEGTSKVINIKLQGEITTEYTSFTSDVRSPKGMVVLSDGSVLVCSNGNKSIYRISEDFKHERKVIDGLNSPQAICYIPDSNKIYIGSVADDYLSVYIL